MTLLHKSLFLAASILFNVVLFFFVLTNPAFALDWQCTDTLYDNTFCDNSVSTSDFCFPVDITDLTCTVSPGVTTICTFCSFGCTSGACDSAPAATPTPVPSCSFGNCIDCILGGPTCGWNGGSCESKPDQTTCPSGYSQWYWTDCGTNVCAAAPTATPTPPPTDTTPPTVSISHSPTGDPPPGSVTLTATASDGGSGVVDMKIYRKLNAGSFTFIKDCTISPPVVSSNVTCSTSETYVSGDSVQIYGEATDNKGNVGITTIPADTFIVGGSGPKASFTVAPSSGPLGTSFSFNGSGSTCTGGCTIDGYLWNFGDGTTGTGATVTHTYGSSTTFSVSLTVTSTVGADTQTQSVIVTPAAATPTPTLAPGQLATPTLLLPDNLATGVSTTPTFTWGSVPLAKAYWVTVNDTTAGTLVVSSSTPINAYTPPVPFVANHTHSWNVQACVNALCSPVDAKDSLVSTTWTFTTAAAVSTPTPTLPPAATATPTPTAGPTPTPTPIPPQACFTIVNVAGMTVTFKDCSTSDLSTPIVRWAWELNGDGATDIDNSSAPGEFPVDYTQFGLVGTHTYTATLTIYDSASVGSAVSHNVTVIGSLPPFCTKSETVTTLAGEQDTTCTEVSTAIGPISVKAASFVTRIMSLLLGVAGGIAVLLIILAGYTLMTSRDNPEAIQEGRQKLLGAIVGLLFIALALVVLQVIGVNVLQIPGFEP